MREVRAGDSPSLFAVRVSFFSGTTAAVIKKYCIVIILFLCGSVEDAG